MKFLIIFASFGLVLLQQVECQGVKGYMNGPAARSRLLTGTKAIKVDREEGGEIEEAETAAMKLIMDGQSDSDIGFDNEEEFHRVQHIKACPEAIDDSATQVQKNLKQRTIQSGVKGRFSETQRNVTSSQADRGTEYSRQVDRQTEYRNETSGSPTRYRVVATSRSSAIIGPQQGIMSRISSEGQRVTRRRRIQSSPFQSKTLQEQPSRDFDQCLEPRKVGPCRGSMSRYWYNPTNGMCEEFLYGGCKGNNNNFLTSDDCMNTCFARGSRRIMLEPIQDSITQQQAEYQTRTRIQPGVKGGFTLSSSSDRSSRRDSGVKRTRIIELESEDLLGEIADEVVPITPTTVDSSRLARLTEPTPRTRFSGQVKMQ